MKAAHHGRKGSPSKRFALLAELRPCPIPPAYVSARACRHSTDIVVPLCREKRREELLLVLQESLGRFEAELQGETALAFTLWDERTPRVYRPKEEERFADVIKQHLVRDLRDRGVIAHREVEIRVRHGRGGLAGERTDIHVDVAEPHSVESRPVRIRAIIEVKGCWHREVLTAMETQLRNRYLRDNDCRHGLYVVGWFLCPQWDTNDSRRAEALRHMPPKIEEANATFEAQARGLSTGGVTLRSVLINASLR